MTTHPQKSPAQKHQRRLAARQEAYDKALRNPKGRAGQLASSGAIHRPGSNKK